MIKQTLSKLGNKLFNGTFSNQVTQPSKMNSCTDHGHLYRDVHAQMDGPHRYRSNFYASWTLWHYRLWSFQGRDTKLERFLAKNQLL